MYLFIISCVWVLWYYKCYVHLKTYNMGILSNILIFILFINTTAIFRLWESKWFCTCSITVITTLWCNCWKFNVFLCLVIKLPWLKIIFYEGRYKQEEGIIGHTINQVNFSFSYTKHTEICSGMGLSKFSISMMSINPSYIFLILLTNASKAQKLSWENLSTS